MRERDLDRLRNGTYDVLVIGGGIQGLATAWEAASRGLKAALIEADDFGSANAVAEQQMAHAMPGLFLFRRPAKARQAIRERRTLARIAPWLLRPLPFLVGTYRSAARPRLALRAACSIDDWLGRSRNEGIEPELHLPRPRLISKAATVRLFPGIPAERLTGGAQWYDYQVVEPDRLVIAFAEAADRAGADLANHVEALEPVRDGKRITGVKARDALTGTSLMVQARTVVNAAGARAGEIMRLFGSRREVPLLEALSVITTRPASDIALVGRSPRGQLLTLLPWRGIAAIGTSFSSQPVRAVESTASEAGIAALIADANGAFPALRLTRGDIALVRSRAVPAAARGNGRYELLTEPEILDHAAEGIGGAISVVGGTYVTARHAAQQALDRLARRMDQRLLPSQTASAVLPGAGIADHEALVIETARALRLDLPLATIRHLISRYAEHAAIIVRLMSDRPELAGPLADGVPTLGVEVLYAVRHEMAATVGDVVMRRTGLGALGTPPKDALDAAAHIVDAELGARRA